MSGFNRRDLLATGAGAAALLSLSTAADAQRRNPEGSAREHAGRRVSAADFGAKGDGRTDDTEALQKALDATFKGRRSGILEVPPGHYLVTRALRIETRGHPEGDITLTNGITAHGARLISRITNGDPVLDLTSRSTVRFTLIEGLQIQGNGREGDGLSIAAMERGTYFYNFCLRDVVVQGCGRDGVRLVGNVFEGQLFNCYLRDNKGNGATFSHGPQNTVLSAVHVFGCVFGGNGMSGAVLVNGAVDVSFHGCYFLLNRKYGLSADNGCTLLSNCGFENNHQAAPSFEKGDAGVRLMVFGTLIGCTAYSIYHQTHLVRAFITNHLVMIGCTASGGQKARGAKLADLQGRPDARITLIGCTGGVDQSKGAHAVELGYNSVGPRFGAQWDSQNLAQLGNHHLWVDSRGRLRIKEGRPQFDEDGTPVGAS